jgi:predicted adenylyl cyclase CyaB
MNKEIEVKLNYKDRISLTKKIEQLGGKKKSSMNLEDVYFGAPGSTMSNKNSITRVRTKKTNNSESELTFKGECKDKNNIWERKEITVKVDDGEIAKQILQSIGLQKISENKSLRESWVLGKCELLFIDYAKPKKIFMLEIEGPTEKEVRITINKLGNLVSEIGEEAFKKFDDSRCKKQ